MKTAKTFDCVEMKDRLQAELDRRQQGMSEEQIREASRRELETSNSPVARFWRSIMRRAEDQ